MLTPLNEIFREKNVIGDLTVFANPFGPVFRHPDAPLPSTDMIQSVGMLNRLVLGRNHSFM